MNYELGDRVIYGELNGTIIAHMYSYGLTRINNNLLHYLDKWAEDDKIKSVSKGDSNEEACNQKIVLLMLDEPTRACSFEDFCKANDLEESEVYRQIYESQVQPSPILLCPEECLEIDVDKPNRGFPIDYIKSDKEEE